MAVRAFLMSRPGVLSVHDLHIWGMSTTESALTAHIVRPPDDAEQAAFLASVTQELHDRFAIEHTTIQIEHGNANVACRLVPYDQV